MADQGKAVICIPAHAALVMVEAGVIAGCQGERYYLHLFYGLQLTCEGLCRGRLTHFQY